MTLEVDLNNSYRLRGPKNTVSNSAVEEGYPVENWRRELKYDPFPPLLSSGKKALDYYARRDLQGESAGSPRVL